MLIGNKFKIGYRTYCFRAAAWGVVHVPWLLLYLHDERKFKTQSYFTAYFYALCTVTRRLTSEPVVGFIQRSAEMLPRKCGIAFYRSSVTGYRQRTSGYLLVPVCLVLTYATMLPGLKILLVATLACKPAFVSHRL